MYLIYKHTFPNGKVYIGLTHFENPEQRWRGGNGYCKNRAMFSAIKKYGWENVVHEILKSELTREEASFYEQQFISEYKSNIRGYGYNFTSGGEKGGTHNAEARKKNSIAHLGIHRNIGVKFSEERKRKLSENHADFSGSKNPAFGRKWTKEEIEIRQSHRTYKRGSENPNARAIVQYTLTNDYIREWGSISEASQFVCCKTSIKNCLCGKYKQGGGYIWKYKEVSNG